MSALTKKLLNSTSVTSDVETEEVHKHSSDWYSSKSDEVSNLSKFNVMKVSKVRIDYLKAAFLLRELEYQIRGRSTTKKTLFHNTCPTNVSSILESNLDRRRVVRSKYGNGVSFTDDVEYGHQWSNGFNSSQAIIVADVLIGNLDYGSSMSTSQDTTVSSNRKVYVKYRDDEFLIKYVIYYNGPEKQRRFRW